MADQNQQHQVQLLGSLESGVAKETGREYQYLSVRLSDGTEITRAFLRPLEMRFMQAVMARG